MSCPIFRDSNRVDTKDMNDDESEMQPFGDFVIRNRRNSSVLRESFDNMEPSQFECLTDKSARYFLNFIIQDIEAFLFAGDAVPSQALAFLHQAIDKFPELIQSWSDSQACLNYIRNPGFGNSFATCDEMLSRIAHFLQKCCISPQLE
uniref:Uncharacterized protein n=2 Tax=Spongospora subterranea TaxID=70186 RepID=A0A0H5QIV7_9EUKA|eukprot:CRZ02035.1 hypothetical protein [Spongospora subterranea]